METKACERCGLKFDLIDIIGKKAVLCRKCFDAEYGSNGFEVSFSGDLRQFNMFADKFLKNENRVESDETMSCNSSNSCEHHIPG